MGRKVQGRDERFIVKDDYMIFYLITDEIQIVHIWDCRRDPDDLVFD